MSMNQVIHGRTRSPSASTSSGAWTWVALPGVVTPWRRPLAEPVVGACCLWSDGEPGALSRGQVPALRAQERRQRRDRIRQRHPRRQAHLPAGRRPLHWTGHSLRIGLASTARKRGRDAIAIAIAIADQGSWARQSRSMLGYMQREDGWDDNASAGLT
ncbi:hypothetical protein ABZS94_28925 [Streptomyces sp. NPDC005500]|uniref:hypothetical protein n=1 Tax=Streptomyces sp. NPDC005500 TaxID=3155007 RepID=UPI0033A8251C